MDYEGVKAIWEPQDHILSIVQPKNITKKHPQIMNMSFPIEQAGTIQIKCAAVSHESL